MKEPKKKVAAAKSDPGLDLTQAERVLAFMTTNHLEEFEFSQGDLHIRLKRAAAKNSTAAPERAPDSSEAAPANSSLATAPAGGVEPPVKAAAPKEELHVIKSPI